MNRSKCLLLLLVVMISSPFSIVAYPNPFTCCAALISFAYNGIRWQFSATYRRQQAAQKAAQEAREHIAQDIKILAKQARDKFKLFNLNLMQCHDMRFWDQVADHHPLNKAISSICCLYCNHKKPHSVIVSIRTPNDYRDDIAYQKYQLKRKINERAGIPFDSTPPEFDYFPSDDFLDECIWHNKGCAQEIEQLRTARHENYMKIKRIDFLIKQFIQ